MKIPSCFRNVPACLMGIGLAATSTALAAAPALQGQITLRPLTPQEIKDYGLAGNQGASGLNTVGVGQPAYLEVLVNAAIPVADITNVTWTLTTQPAGSGAALAPSPLGTNVPTYKMADRYNNSGAPVYQVAGRILLRPDVTGQYKVTALVQTGASGSTNLTQTINAGTYMGLNTCALCHSGGQIADNIVTPWSETPHATFFTRAIDGLESDHYSKNCVSCHTVGYDVNTNAINGGFDDVALQLGWTFPPVLTNGNWAKLPAALKNLSNIQCENCHGPGSQHAYSLGDTNLISKTFAAGDCAQCHDSKPNHVRNAEWNNSLHARATRTPSGSSRINCVRCHTAGGFAGYIENLGNTGGYATNTVYEAISCQACHDPHDASNPHQLRAGSDSITLACGVKVTNAGSGTICLNCHQSRTGSVTNSLEKYPLGQPTWANGSSFGPHDNPAADMLEGVNGYTYGKKIPSSAHRDVVKDACATCHMQPVASTDPGFTKVGGHSFNMSYTDSTGALVEKVDVCTQCHGPIEDFSLQRDDYDGDGVIDGIQTEVTHLIDKLSTLMPNSAYRADGNYVADGLVKTSLSVKTNWQAKFLQGAWNWQLVNYDHSKGIHNAAYAVGLLKASIADLTGDANDDGLPDSWQIQYFGSANDPKAAPNATPAGDGVPNWLKYGLGLDPMVPGIVLPEGVVWANAGQVGGTNMTDKVQIFTAAEVVYNTEIGKTYQLQAISSLDGGWKNIGDPVAGTGTAVSFVTPTRTSQQQFYRVEIK